MLLAQNTKKHKKKAGSEFLHRHSLLFVDVDQVLLWKKGCLDRCFGETKVALRSPGSARAGQHWSLSCYH